MGEITPKKVLLVCTGNLCRSPMATGLLRQMLKDRGLAEQVEVYSAGTNALEGGLATPLAIYVMAQQGISISNHRSHRVTAEDTDRADLVLVMTQEHREALLAELPETKRKLFLLSEMAGAQSDIEDPIYSQDIDNYAKCAQEIRNYLERGFPRLVEFLGIEAPSG